MFPQFRLGARKPVCQLIQKRCVDWEDVPPNLCMYHPSTTASTFPKHPFPSDSLVWCFVAIIHFYQFLPMLLESVSPCCLVVAFPDPTTSESPCGRGSRVEDALDLPLDGGLERWKSNGLPRLGIQTMTLGNSLICQYITHHERYIQPLRSGSPTLQC